MKHFIRNCAGMLPIMATLQATVCDALAIGSISSLFRRADYSERNFEYLRVQQKTGLNPYYFLEKPALSLPRVSVCLPVSCFPTLLTTSLHFHQLLTASLSCSASLASLMLTAATSPSTTSPTSRTRTATSPSSQANAGPSTPNAAKSPSAPLDCSTCSSRLRRCTSR